MVATDFPSFVTVPPRLWENSGNAMCESIAVNEM